MPNKKLYVVNAFFRADRKLTSAEEALIEAAIAAQISEPVDEDGEDLDVSIQLGAVFVEEMR